MLPVNQRVFAGSTWLYRWSKWLKLSTKTSSVNIEFFFRVVAQYSVMSWMNTSVAEELPRS
jgi:hypothetical protein